jgi:hypothetical protein
LSLATLINLDDRELLILGRRDTAEQEIFLFAMTFDPSNATVATVKF